LVKGSHSQTACVQLAALPLTGCVSGQGVEIYCASTSSLVNGDNCSTRVIGLCEDQMSVSVAATHFITVIILFYHTILD